jgi:hypothetical protein
LTKEEDDDQIAAIQKAAADRTWHSNRMSERHQEKMREDAKAVRDRELREQQEQYARQAQASPSGGESSTTHIILPSSEQIPSAGTGDNLASSSSSSSPSSLSLSSSFLLFSS